MKKARLGDDSPQIQHFFATQGPVGSTQSALFYYAVMVDLWKLCFWGGRKVWQLIGTEMFSSVQSLRVMSNSLQPHGLQHSRPPCPSLTPGVYSNSCLLHWWCHPTISSSVVPFSSCPQSFPASGSFPVSQFFASGGQSIRVSASVSVLPMNIQDWFPLGLTVWISLQSTVQKQQFFGAQRSL